MQAARRNLMLAPGLRRQGLRDDNIPAVPKEEAALRSIVVLPALCLAALLAQGAPVNASDMKSTAPEKMLPPSEAKKMRACDDKAMRLKIPMEQKAAFVKKCMAEMK